MCTTLVTLKTLKLANGICVRCCLRLPGVHSAVCSELKVLNYAPCNRKEHQVGVNVHTVLCTSVHQCFVHRVHQCAQCARVSWKCWGVLHINSLLLGRSAHSMTITMLAIMLMWWTPVRKRREIILNWVCLVLKSNHLSHTNKQWNPLQSKTHRSQWDKRHMILQKRSTKAMSEMALRQGRFIFPQAGEVMLDWLAIFQSKQIEILANKKLFTRNMCHKSHLISSTCPHWRNFEKGFNSGLNEYSGIHFVPGCGN